MKRAGTIAFLTIRMVRGYGVAVSIDSLVRELMRAGQRVVVGCMENDDTFTGVPIKIVRPSASSVQDFVRSEQVDTVVAQTTPYFELLPAVPHSISRWAWENGDPSPEFFSSDGAERAAIKQHKVAHVYPVVDGVIAISKFIRHDINWPKAHVIYLGCDHIEDCGPKRLSDFSLASEAKIKVGTLMRMGPGEANYKGIDAFFELQELTKSKGLPVEYRIMGKGDEEYVGYIRDKGIDVHLNATDEERMKFIRSLDVFFTPSLWEGCNLPLVEAQAAGTVGMALDVGAHPEMTPFVYSSLLDIVSVMERYAEDKPLLWHHSRLSYHFVRSRYSWSQAAQQAIQLLEPRQPSTASIRSRRFWPF